MTKQAQLFKPPTRIHGVLPSGRVMGYGFCECGCGFKTNKAKRRYVKPNGEVIEAGAHYRFLANHHKRARPGLTRAMEATASPTTLDIAWAAGIYEGEGTANCYRKDGWKCRVSVCQKDQWILHRLRSLFGGSLHTRAVSGVSSWNVTGPRGRGFLMTIYKFLSPRRKEQALRALGEKVGDLNAHTA